MVPGARLVILGKQGAGKGTQCVRLSRHFVVPHISTGDMFRAEVRTGSDLGRRVQGYLDAGQLIPDDVVMSVIDQRLHQPDALGRGFVLDGVPRTLSQADELDRIIAPLSLDLVVSLEVPLETVLERLATRMVCADCQTNYSRQSLPKVKGVCDVCGGEVVSRRDDNGDAIAQRLKLYEEQTAPLLDHYASRGILLEVDGSGPVDEVTLELITRVDGELGRRRGGK